MQIIVDGGYEFVNVGDIAMLQATVSRLSRLWPGARIRVITDSPDRLACYCPAAIPLQREGLFTWMKDWNVLGSLHRMVPEAWKSQLRRIEALLRMNGQRAIRRWVEFRLARRGVDMQVMRRFLDLMARSDVVVACGGGNVTDVFKDSVRFQLELLGLARAMGKTVAMFGQGLGPVRSRPLRALMRDVLPRLNFIAVREGRRGPQLLRALGVGSSAIIVTGDDAIEQAYFSRPCRLGEAMGVNVRIADYSGVAKSQLDALQWVILEATRRHACRLLPVPIRIRGPASDPETLRRMFGGSLDDWGYALDTPELVIRQVGQCRVVITGSYHAGVFALAQGASVVGLVKSEYYRDKFLGLAERFGAGCRVLELDHPGVYRRAFEAIDDAWREAPRVRPLLLKAAEAQLCAGWQAYQRLREVSLRRALYERQPESIRVDACLQRSEVSGRSRRERSGADVLRFRAPRC